MKKVDGHKREADILQLDIIRPILKDPKMLARYHQYNALIVPTLYHNPEGIHGVSHIRRTLLLALLMAYLDKLSNQQTRLLAYASVYHDIGREHDGKDDYHGYDSYQKATALRLLKKLSEKEVRIVRELIERHAIDDTIAFALDTVAADIQDEVWFLLRYFKDADNLDRVRIYDLNIEYLRTDIARKMPSVAQQLLVRFSDIMGIS